MDSYTSAGVAAAVDRVSLAGRESSNDVATIDFDNLALSLKQSFSVVGIFFQLILTCPHKNRPSPNVILKMPSPTD